MVYDVNSEPHSILLHVNIQFPYDKSGFDDISFRTLAPGRCYSSLLDSSQGSQDVLKLCTSFTDQVEVFVGEVYMCSAKWIETQGG